jgi:hypothetical protein
MPNMTSITAHFVITSPLMFGVMIVSRTIAAIVSTHMVVTVASDLRHTPSPFPLSDPHARIMI